MVPYEIANIALSKPLDPVKQQREVAIRINTSDKVKRVRDTRKKTTKAYWKLTCINWNILVSKLIPSHQKRYAPLHSQLKVTCADENISIQRPRTLQKCNSAQTKTCAVPGLGTVSPSSSQSYNIEFSRFCESNYNFIWPCLNSLAMFEQVSDLNLQQSHFHILLP